MSKTAKSTTSARGKQIQNERDHRERERDDDYDDELLSDVASIVSSEDVVNNRKSRKIQTTDAAADYGESGLYDRGHGRRRRRRSGRSRSRSRRRSHSRRRRR